MSEIHTFYKIVANRTGPFSSEPEVTYPWLSDGFNTPLAALPVVGDVLYGIPEGEDTPYEVVAREWWLAGEASVLLFLYPHSPAASTQLAERRSTCDGRGCDPGDCDCR